MDQKHTHTVDEASVRRSGRVRKTPWYWKEFVLIDPSAVGFHSSTWADQVPIAVAPLNSVPYTGPPLDGCDSQDLGEQNGVSPRMLYLSEQPTPQQMDDIMSATKHGVLVSGSAAKGIIGPLMGSYDLAESDDGFLFRFALPGVEKNEKFKCEVQADGTLIIQGVTNTGGKQVHSNNMVFEMHSQNLCPPGDFALRFHLSTHVDPSTLEVVLDNGVLEGVIKKQPVQGS